MDVTTFHKTAENTVRLQMTAFCFYLAFPQRPDFIGTGIVLPQTHSVCRARSDSSVYSAASSHLNGACVLNEDSHELNVACI